MTPAILRRRRVVVLPDLFLDVLVPMPAWADAAQAMDAIAGRGGGNLPVGPIEVRPGGNAANLALGLARLGVQVELVAATDALGFATMRQAAAGFPLGLDHVEVFERASATVALECGDANVMLSHAGPVADFGPERISAAAWQAIETADAVAVVNWAQNRKGTHLLEEVVSRADDALVYFDTGDPRHRPDAAGLLDAKAWAGVGAWGLNENELLAFTGRAAPIHDDELLQVGRGLAKRLGTCLDLHTRTFAASITPQQTVQVPADPTPARRLTGAGDAWNAGNLAGYLADLPPKERLQMAHESATRHVTRATA